MIYLIIGPSCSGKTQFVTNSFIKGSQMHCFKDLVKVTETENCFLIGDFTIEKKIRGTDTISRSQLKLISPQIIKLFNETDKDIVAEGVNLCWSFVFDALLPYKNDIVLIYLNCSKDISLQRNCAIGSTAKDSSFKAMWTRTDNIFNKYCSYFDSYVYCTDTIDDFSEFGLSAIELQKVNSIPRLF